LGALAVDFLAGALEAAERESARWWRKEGMSARERGRDGRVDQGEKGRKRRGEVNSRALEAGALEAGALEAGAFWPVVCNERESKEGGRMSEMLTRERKNEWKLDWRKQA
jgi:hypothetical protein